MGTQALFLTGKTLVAGHTRLEQCGTTLVVFAGCAVSAIVVGKSNTGVGPNTIGNGGDSGAFALLLADSCFFAVVVTGWQTLDFRDHSAYLDGGLGATTFAGTAGALFAVVVGANFATVYPVDALSITFALYRFTTQITAFASTAQLAKSGCFFSVGESERCDAVGAGESPG